MVLRSVVSRRGSGARAREPAYLFGMVNDATDFREPHLRDRDFLGSFALVETDAGVLMVENERRIGGTATRVWDLPGGQVEPGELLVEALARELHEELGVRPRDADFVFFQEGERVLRGRRRYAWRSFFVRVREWDGALGTGAERLPWRWVPRSDLHAVLVAPYHDSFRNWLATGGARFVSTWAD